MKYINKFSTSADYQAFTEGGGYVTPNICYVEETDGIVLKPYIEPEKEIITFTIDGTQCQAEEGMTWGEWANSEYNTEEVYTVSSSGILKVSDENGQLTRYTLYTNDYIWVSQNDYIINNKSYIFIGEGAGC